MLSWEHREEGGQVGKCSYNCIVEFVYFNHRWQQCATIKPLWSVLQESEDRTVILFNKPTPRYRSMGNKLIYQRKMYSPVYCNTICTCQEMETNCNHPLIHGQRKCGTYTHVRI